MAFASQSRVNFASRGPGTLWRDVKYAQYMVRNTTSDKDKPRRMRIEVIPNILNGKSPCFNFSCISCICGTGLDKMRGL